MSNAETMFHNFLSAMKEHRPKDAHQVKSFIILLLSKNS